MNGNKYDLIVSIGEDCACSAFLRNNKLQFPSFPFDWLMHANFETRVNLLMTNFSDFLNKDDVIPLEKTGELAVENLSQKFSSKEIHLLVLENKKGLLSIKQKKISDKITRFFYDMFSSDNSSALSKVMGNKVLGNQILSNYKLRLSICFKIKVFFLNCLPIKKIRRKIRERLYNKC